MAADDLELKNRDLWIQGAYSAKPVFLKNARVTEGLSKITEMTVEFLTSNAKLDVHDFLGKAMAVGIKDDKSADRFFSGTCISVEYIGLYQGLHHYVADVRSWLWFLTRTRENRIFQDKTVVEIIQEVISDYGFSSKTKSKLSGSYKKRTYCVQYRETDFDFISRLMEEEGIYYFFDQNKDTENMILADSVRAHEPTPNFSTIEFYYREAEYRRTTDHIFEWNTSALVTPGKVTLDDFDFEKPKADKKSVKAMPKGKHSYKNFEHFKYPGHLRTTGTDSDFTRVAVEALAAQHELSRGVCNVRTIGAGQTFKMKEHPQKDLNDEYLVVNAVHHLQIETDYEDDESTLPLIDNRLPADDRNKDTYRCFMDVIPKKVPFRAPQTTPWPEISGLQTAIVTGPSGDEIHTDKYGRIKVKFHWDRSSTKEDKTTCWVRCVMPWTGKNWGMISVPRIGQEVAIQFEEGDPDKPICTGMLYNADTMPPYALPANMTQTGIKTRSTKKGGKDNFNELVFEDKKDSEFVRLQSEKDFKQIIKNDATITIGLEKKDKGDLTQTIHRNKTETLNTGDHTFTVKDGKQTIKVKKDHTETLEAKATQTITGNTTQTIKTGNYVQTLNKGNVTRTLKMGNEKVSLKMGNYDLKAALGKIKEEALQSIELKVGANSIKIDQMGVTIKGMMVKIQGTAMLEAKSPMSQIKGDGLLILKGGMTMIN